MKTLSAYYRRKINGNYMKLRTYLLAATILTTATAAQGRESFYNLRNTQPSISINLTALGNLTPDVQSSAANTLNGGGAPAVVDHPVYNYSTPGKKTANVIASPTPAQTPAPIQIVTKPKTTSAAPANPAPFSPVKQDVTLPSEPSVTKQLAENLPPLPSPAAKPVVDLPSAPPTATPITNVPTNTITTTTTTISTRRKFYRQLARKL